MANASLSPANECRDVAIIESPTAARQLGLLVESIRLAAPPAFFALWQDDPDSLRRFVDVLVEAGLTTPHVIRPNKLAAKLDGLEKRAYPLSEDDGIIFLGCLTAMHEEERKQFNAARDRLLQLGTKIIFVESVAEEGKVRLAFPDVFSQVTYDCRLFLRAGEEDPFATSNPPSRQQADARNEGSALLTGTVHEVHETEAVCWLEVGPGARVKFSVPVALLNHLNPQPGLELLWSPGNEEKPPTFWTPKPEPPDPQLLSEFDELTRRFHEDLKHRKPRLPKDIAPHHE